MRPRVSWWLVLAVFLAAIAWGVHRASAQGQICHTGSSGGIICVAGPTTGVAPTDCAPQFFQSLAADGTITCNAPVGRVASITGPVAIANTETVVVSYAAPANTLGVGTTIRASAFFTESGASAASPVYRLRVGPTTLSGNIPASLTGSFAGAGTPIGIEGIATVRTIGAGGTIAGSASVAVNTTVQNLIELTYISGHASDTATFSNALLEIL